MAGNPSAQRYLDDGRNLSPRKTPSAPLEQLTVCWRRVVTGGASVDSRMAADCFQMGVAL